MKRIFSILLVSLFLLCCGCHAPENGNVSPVSEEVYAYFREICPTGSFFEENGLLMYRWHSDSHASVIGPQPELPSPGEEASSAGEDIMRFGILDVVGGEQADGGIYYVHQYLGEALHPLKEGVYLHVRIGGFWWGVPVQSSYAEAVYISAGEAHVSSIPFYTEAPIPAGGGRTALPAGHYRVGTPYYPQCDPIEFDLKLKDGQYEIVVYYN